MGFTVVARSTPVRRSPPGAKADATKQSTAVMPWQDGLLRGACHRARIRATRWLAMTSNPLAQAGMSQPGRREAPPGSSLVRSP